MTTDEAAIEAMARAMAVNNNDYDWEGAKDKERVLQWNLYVSDARAALAALREMEAGK